MRAIPIALLVALAARPLGAQLVMGRVVDLVTAEPVGEGFVLRGFRDVGGHILAITAVDGTVVYPR